jgi:hypothetical protein
VITSLNRKYPACVGKFTFLDVLHPGPIHTDRQIMFLLASHSTGMTSDAFPIVDNEPKIRHASRIIDLNAKETKNILDI